MHAHLRVVRRERQLGRHGVDVRLHVSRGDLAEQLDPRVAVRHPFQHDLHERLRVGEEVGLRECLLVDEAMVHLEGALDEPLEDRPRLLVEADVEILEEPGARDLERLAEHVLEVVRRACRLL